MNPPLVESLCLELTGGSSLARLASMIVLAEELSHLQRLLDYHGTGRRTIGEKASFTHSSWEEFCRIEAGLTETTHRAYKKYREVLTHRLQLSGKPESKALLELMAKQPSTLATVQRQSMIEEIMRLALLPGDTATSLLKEFKNQAPQPPEPKKTCDIKSGTLAVHEDPFVKIEALAIACGVSPENARRVAQILRIDRAIKKAAPRAVKLLRERDANGNRHPSKKGHHKS